MSLQNKKNILTRSYQVIIILDIVAAMILFTACGQTTTTNTSTATPVLTATGTATLPLHTGGVTLHTDRTSYQQKNTISATLKNQSNQTIYFPDHLTDCSVILLQRLPAQPLSGDSGQAGINSCRSEIVTRMHSLAPGQTLVVKLLSPSSGWPPGLYRATLTYNTALKQPKTIYTAAFTVSPFAPQP